MMRYQKQRQENLYCHFSELGQQIISNNSQCIFPQLKEWKLLSQECLWKLSMLIIADFKPTIYLQDGLLKVDYSKSLVTLCNPKRNF